MHANVTAVREIHLALTRGDLDGARLHARTLARLPATGDLGAWAAPVRFLRAQAGRVASATSAREAGELAAELATVCADCHMASARDATFPRVPRPANDGTLASSMARHEWAAESMWIGIIAPSTPIWREGLEAITLVPIETIAAATRQERLDMDRLRRQLVALGTSRDELRGQGDRARRLAEIVAVCAGCHQIARR